jgi:4'-phosphopantetheinyl transferase
MACEAGRNWYFSLSHSGDFIYVAAARGVRVGVDVERLRPRTDYASVGKLCLSEGEQRQLRRIAEPERGTAFLRMWCGKEAYVKAVGKGMHLPLHTVHVGVRPESGSPRGAVGWTLAELEAAPGYVAALAVESRQVPVVRMVKPA